MDNAKRYAVLDDEGKVVNIILAEPDVVPNLGLNVREARDEDKIELPEPDIASSDEPQQQDDMAQLAAILERLDRAVTRLESLLGAGRPQGETNNS